MDVATQRARLVGTERPVLVTVSTANDSFAFWKQSERLVAVARAMVSTCCPCRFFKPLDLAQFLAVFERLALPVAIREIKGA
jgi:hypothetical protein